MQVCISSPAYLPPLAPAPDTGFTEIGSPTTFYNAGGLDSIVISRTGVTAGNLLVVWASGAGNMSSPSCSSSESGAFDDGTLLTGPIDSLFFYKLSATGGDEDITVTLGGTLTFRAAIVYEFSYTGTIAHDQEAGVAADTTPFSSGDITTTSGAGHGLAIGAMVDGDLTNASSDEQINGVAADGVTRFAANSFASSWYRIVTSQFTGAATATSASPGANIQIDSFKVT